MIGETLHVAGGGAMIGLAAAALWLLLGRVAGISGIAARTLLQRPTSDLGWQAAFLLGLCAAGYFAPSPVPGALASPSALALGGVLVGVGARVGSGCTSGHGVCGVSRRSPRSIVAVALFTLFGALATWGVSCVR